MRLGIECGAASCPLPSLVSDERLCRKHLKVTEGVPPTMNAYCGLGPGRKGPGSAGKEGRGRGWEGTKVTGWLPPKAATHQDLCGQPELPPCWLLHSMGLSLSTEGGGASGYKLQRTGRC